MSRSNRTIFTDGVERRGIRYARHRRQQYQERITLAEIMEPDFYDYEGIAHHVAHEFSKFPSARVLTREPRL